MTVPEKKSDDPEKAVNWFFMTSAFEFMTKILNCPVVSKSLQGL